MITILKETPETDLTYYSRLSDEAQNDIVSTKQAVESLVNTLSQHKDILTFTDDKLYDVFYNAEEGDEDLLQMFCSDTWEDFENYLNSLDLITKQFNRSNSKFYIRTGDTVDNFLYELENEDIDFETVLNAINDAYLSYNASYIQLTGALMNPSEIDTIIKDECSEYFNDSIEDAVDDWNGNIIDFCYEVNDSINQILEGIKPIIKAYDYVINFKNNQVKYWNEYKRNYEED